MIRISLFVIVLCFSMSAFGHGGGLDRNGCHTNRKTGEYHCHRGGYVNPGSRADTSGSQLSDTQCGAKRYCNEMSSCKEALHYLRDCGLSRLDGDGDGVPCESLCRGRY